MQPSGQPWDKRPGESARAFAAFDEYCRMGVERSIAKVAQKLGKNKALLDRWSQTHEWVARAAAFDAHERQQQQALEAEHRQQMRLAFEQQRQEAAQMRQLTIQTLHAMLNRVTKAEHDGKYNVDAKTLRELSTAAAAIFKESRLEFGEPTEITDQRQWQPALALLPELMATLQKHGVSLEEYLKAATEELNRDDADTTGTAHA